MTASRKEYWTDLLEDCEDILKEFEGCDDNGKANIIAAMVLADALNGLRKAIHGRVNETR